MMIDARLHKLGKRAKRLLGVSLTLASLIVVASGMESKDVGARSERDDASFRAVARSLRALSRLRSYRIRMTIYLGTETKGSKGVFEVLAPDRTHLVIENDDEIIEISKTIYRRSRPDAPWEKEGQAAENKYGPSPFNTLFINARQLDVSLKRVSEVKFVGTEMIDGVKTKAYQFKYSYDNGESDPVKVWIGVADGMVRKCNVETAADPRQAFSFSVKILARFYDYNAEIKIEPPLP